MNIYLVAPHQEKFDEAYIDITTIYTRKEEAIEAAKRRSENGTISKHSVWTCNAAKYGDRFLKIIAAFDKGKELSTADIDEII